MKIMGITNTQRIYVISQRLFARCSSIVSDDDDNFCDVDDIMIGWPCGCEGG